MKTRGSSDMNYPKIKCRKKDSRRSKQFPDDTNHKLTQGLEVGFTYGKTLSKARTQEREQGNKIIRAKQTRYKRANEIGGTTVNRNLRVLKFQLFTAEYFQEITGCKIWFKVKWQWTI